VTSCEGRRSRRPEHETLDPAIQAVLDGMLAAPGPPAHEMPIDQARAAHVAESEELGGPPEPVAEARDLEIPGPGGDIRLRVLRPEAEGALPVVAYVHGGGWSLGSVDSFEAPMRALANASGAVVAGVEYRLAPEHRFPAALNDTLAAVRWLAEAAGEVGGDPERLAVAGDSAGGNLAAVAALRLRGEVPLRMQALIYPVVDSGVNTPSYREFGDGYGLTAAGMRRFWELYLDGADGAQPDVSPLRCADLAGAPPAYVLTADHDVLRDEAEAYAAALERAGVPVTVKRWPGTIHGFWRWLAATDAAPAAIAEVGGALRRALA
jgi:acetyl esterase